MVQLWGWPGSGKGAILRALAAQQGEDALWLDSAQLAADGGELPKGRWLLVEVEARQLPSVHQLSSRLGAGQRLVIAAQERCAPPSARLGLIEPWELLLTSEEVGSLLADGREAEPPIEGQIKERASQLLKATDGWYEPLRIILDRELEGVAGGTPSLRELGSSDPLYSFISRRLLALLTPELLAALLELSLADSLSPEIWREVWCGSPSRLRGWKSIDEDWGLSSIRSGGERLPRLLVAACRRWLSDSWPASRVRERCRRLALVCYGQDRAEAALQALLFAGDFERATTLAQLSWLRVWSAVRVSVVRRIVEQTDTATAPEFALLRWSLAAIEGDQGAARAGLEGLAARQRSHPLVAAAAALALAVLDPTPAAAAAARTARRELNESGETQRGELRTLLQVVEFGQWNGVDATEVESLAGRLARLRFARTRHTPLASVAPADPTASPSPRGASAESAFEVQLLGVPRVGRLSGLGTGEPRSEEIQWSLRRAFLIFAFLASTPEARASREAIVEAAWPSADESMVERNFHPTLSHLRRALRRKTGSPACLEYVNGIYQLNPRIDWRIDSREFNRLAKVGRQRAEAGETEAAVIAYESAWRLYRGPFLEGFYESWVEERREALTAIHLDSLRRLGELHLALGNAERAIDGFRAVLVADPLQEGVHLSIMRIYAQQGRRDLVRRQYDRLTQLLRDELLVEPMEETTSEYQRLMG